MKHCPIFSWFQRRNFDLEGDATNSSNPSRNQITNGFVDSEELLRAQNSKISGIISHYNTTDINLTLKTVHFSAECLRKYRNYDLDARLWFHLYTGLFLGVYCKKYGDDDIAIKHCKELQIEQTYRGLSVAAWSMIRGACNDATAAKHTKNTHILYAAFLAKVNVIMQYRKSDVKKLDELFSELLYTGYIIGYSSI